MQDKSFKVIAFLLLVILECHGVRQAMIRAPRKIGLS